MPTILTTSQKLSTGVDALNIRNIVLMRPIRSMVEFKQIIGRGTRMYEGKDFFTIFDFVKAHEHFNDAEWDGEPLPPDDDGGKGKPTGPIEGEPPSEGDPPIIEEPLQVRTVVKLSDGRQRSIQYLATTTYWHQGRQITAQEFMEELFGDLGTLVASEDELRRVWSDPQRREALMQRLLEMGYDHERLEDMRRLIDAPNSDIFDVLAYVRFSLPPHSRLQRVQTAKRPAWAVMSGRCTHSWSLCWTATSAKAFGSWHRSRSRIFCAFAMAESTTQSAPSAVLRTSDVLSRRSRAICF